MRCCYHASILNVYTESTVYMFILGWCRHVVQRITWNTGKYTSSLRKYPHTWSCDCFAITVRCRTFFIGIDQVAPARALISPDSMRSTSFGTWSSDPNSFWSIFSAERIATHCKISIVWEHGKSRKNTARLLWMTGWAGLAGLSGYYGFYSKKYKR